MLIPYRVLFAHKKYNPRFGPNWKRTFGVSQGDQQAAPERQTLIGSGKSRPRPMGAGFSSGANPGRASRLDKWDHEAQAVPRRDLLAMGQGWARGKSANAWVSCRSVRRLASRDYESCGLGFDDRRVLRSPPFGHES